MKKTLLLLLLLGFWTTGVVAQVNNEPTKVNSNKAAKKYKTTKEPKSSGKLLWGLYRWGSEKDKKTRTKDFAFEFETAGFKKAKRQATKLDTSKYETRSILGGAIQWTQRKKKRKKD